MVTTYDAGFTANVGFNCPASGAPLAPTRTPLSVKASASGVTLGGAIACAC